MSVRSEIQKHPSRALAVVLCTASLVAACGGGGDSGGTGAGGGAGGSAGTADPAAGLAVGTITGFGSIYVNGIHYDTDDAVFQIDGSPGTQADLAVGDKVTVIGTVSDDGMSGVATLVTYEAEIEAPVQSIDLLANSFVAAGQTVFVANDTVFEDDIEPGTLEGLTVGDFVDVSGYFGADGALLASRIELDEDRDEIEVTGFITGIDSAASTFSVGELDVDYSGAVFEDITAESLTEGLLVEVYAQAFDAGGTLLATRVENEEDDDERGGQNGRGALSGFVTTFFAADDFEVNGQPVTTTAQTVFVNGSVDSLGPNVRVTVIGDYDAAGVLVARRLIVKLATNLIVEAPVEAIDVETRTFTVLGIAVRTDGATQFEDDDDGRNERYFGIEDLATGDFVEVRGAADPDGLAAILATRVERDDDDDDDDLEDVELRGYVERVDAQAGTLVILGVTVQASSGFETFLERVAPGDLVEAEGRVIGDALLVADELGFEREDHNDGRDHWRGDEDGEEDDDEDDEDDVDDDD